MEQRQQQRLTAAQVLYVNMLEMTPAEIEREVTHAIEVMPALEVVNHDSAVSAEIAEENNFNESAEELQRKDYGNEDEIPAYRLEAHNYSTDSDYYEPVAANEEPTLAESLENQLEELHLDEQSKIIARYIIGNLDSNGYIRRDLPSIANDMAINGLFEPTGEQMRRVFDIVRSLDPAGVGATGLRDCLLLQLRRLPSKPAGRLALEIVEKYFDIFTLKHYQRLANILHVSDKKIKEAAEIILHLDPKPGSSLANKMEERSMRIVPEFAVESDGTRLSVSLLDNIPELTIAQSFLVEPDSPTADMSHRQKEEAVFVREKRDEARSFIKTLSMRQKTLTEVMTVIAEIQRPFFMSGDTSRLKPMVLRDIAARTGLDLSVISRATASKYVVTDAGVFPLKFFFNESVSDDSDVSYHQIAGALREIIENENKKSPLSDEAITALLNDSNFNVARRTVSKYREKLGIPVARLRKQF